MSQTLRDTVLALFGRLHMVFFLQGVLAFCPDESWPESVILTRTILKDGFHRVLLTTVNLGTLTNTAVGCTILTKELLPAGVFADPYQLASLRQYGILEALLMKPVDIEAPEYLSSSQSVLVYMKSDPSCAGCFSATVPVHGRYHRPSEDKNIMAPITVENPKLLVRCLKGLPSQECWSHDVEVAPCTAENQTYCHWAELKYKHIPEDLTFQVPVGHRDHLLVVSSVTVLVTVICCSIITFAICKHGHFHI